MAPVGRGGGRGLGVKHDEALLEIDRSRRGLRRRRSAGAVRRRARRPRRRLRDPALCAADFRVGCRARRALARRRCAGAAPEMAVRAAFARRASLPGQRAARGARRRRRGRKLGLRLFLAYARAAAQACDLSADLERRAKKLLAAAPKLRAKGAGAALQALLDDDSLSASRQKSARKYPSAAREGCSTASSRSARSAN